MSQKVFVGWNLKTEEKKSGIRMYLWKLKHQPTKRMNSQRILIFYQSQPNLPSTYIMRLEL